MTSQPAFSTTEVHDDAKDRITFLADNYKAKLTAQAQILAGDDKVVLRSHVERAQRIITNKANETWLPEIAKFTGGACFGAGLSSFLTEVTLSPIRVYILILAFLLVIVGITMQAIGMIISNREK